MTKYRCGHETNGTIILDDNIMSMTTYIQWAEEDNNLRNREKCFDCFLGLDEKDKEVVKK